MFAWNAELEAAVREDPDDDGRWSVLEDWILEQDDARAHHVRLSKAGDHDAALRVTWEIAKDLLEIEGTAWAGFHAAMAGCRWRAGYIEHGYFEGAPSARRMQMLHEFLGKRATSLMRQLRITIDTPLAVSQLCKQLAKATCKQSLRRLIIAAYWKPASQAVTLDASALAPLQLDELRFYDRAIRIEYAEPLSRLRKLAVMPGAAGDPKALFVDGGFPALRELDLDLRTLEHRGWTLDHIDFAVVAPKLEILRIKASDEMFAAVRSRASGIDVQRG